MDAITPALQIRDWAEAENRLAQSDRAGDPRTGSQAELILHLIFFSKTLITQSFGGPIIASDVS